ncbi:hypothetical protein ACIL6B_005349, partial [Escherichia coli]
MDKNMLIASSFGLYDAEVAHMATGFSSLNQIADSRLHSDMRFFCVRKPTHTRIMAGRNGGAFALAGSYLASLLTPLRLATMFSSVVARLLNQQIGAFHMAVSARTSDFCRPYPSGGDSCLKPSASFPVLLTSAAIPLA